MLTRLARFALAAEALLYGAIGYWLHTVRDWPLAALVAAAIVTSLGLRLGFVAASMLLAWSAARAQPEHRRLAPREALALLAGEFRAVARSNYWSIPFEQLALRPDRTPEPGDRIPVILVHGYFSNRGYFSHMLRWLEENGVHPVFAPDFPATFATVEAFTEALHLEIERICEGTRQPRVILVCHSLGGLAARLYVATHGSGRVAKLITLASPHAGTALARFGLGANARQMIQGSEFLEGLAAGEARHLAGLRATSIYSLHDNLVSPQATSRLAWARNVGLEGLGHVTILVSRDCFAALLEELREAGA